MNDLFSYYKKLLTEAMAIKSISTDPDYATEMKRMADWFSDTLKGFGFTISVLESEKTNPVIVAKYIVDPSKETFLIYGHYDVQPADQPGWNSEAFTLTEKDGRLYGRGAVDNKGQVLIHIAAIGVLIKEKKLDKNITFVIEGNEETGNEDLPTLLEKNKELFACDVVLVSDGELRGDNPVIECSLRGGANMKVIYKTANSDVHSGIYGGVIPNAGIELSHMISKMFDSKNNRVAIDGFYKDCVDLDKIEKLNPDHIEDFLHNRALEMVTHAGGKVSLCELDDSNTGIKTHIQTGARPTLQVSGISSGYIGNGYANIVPHYAEARINLRTVAPQKVNEVISSIERFIRMHTPEYITLEFAHVNPHEASEFSVNNEKVKEAKQLLQKVFDKEVFMTRVGGAIPIVVDMSQKLGAEALLIPFGNDDCNMHGPNENMRIEIAKKGLAFSSEFFGKCV